MTTIRRVLAILAALFLAATGVAQAQRSSAALAQEAPQAEPIRQGEESRPVPSPDGAPAGYERLGPPVRLADVEGGSLLLSTEARGVYLPAPSLETEVEMRIRGPIARVQVRQRFHNPTDAWVEGVYVFPLPERSAVDGLRLVVGDRVIEGQIREREEAKQVYEQAKREGKKASLVEQERPNLFTTSVANLGPDETVEVVLHYQEDLRYDAGRFELRFPLVAPVRYVTGDSEDPMTGPGSGVGTGPVQVAGHLARAAGLGSVADVVDTLPPRRPVVTDAARLWSPVVPPVPLVHDGPGGPDGKGTGAINPVTLRVILDAGFPLAEVASPSHAIRTIKRRNGRVEVDLVPSPGQSFVPADRDFVLDWRPRVGREPGAAIFTEVVDGTTYALLTVMPPSVAAHERSRPLPREAIYVIDTSGSMGGPSIEQAKAALERALDRLRPEDSFNIIRFDSRTDALFQESLPAGPRALEMAHLFVDSLEAGGGTEMLPALRLALDTPPVRGAVRQVVFITDGAVADEDRLFATIQERLGATRLFTVGIGSAPNGHFMRRAAELGRGSFTYIGRVEEVGPRMAELFTKIDSPVLTDLEVEWSDPGAETWPQRVPDLYAGEPLVIAARLPGVVPGALASGAAGGASVRIVGRRGDRIWRVEERLGGIAAKRGGGGERRGVAKLWARRKIAALMDQRTAGAPEATVRSEVIDVALAHHLVSKYTSLVAVDLTPTRPSGELPHTLRLPVNLPAGWVAEQVIGSMPTTATPARLLLLLGLAALGAGWLLLGAPHVARGRLGPPSPARRSP